MIRIIIAGSRDFNDYELLKEKMDTVIANFPTERLEIVSGGARGADALGVRYAQERNLNYCIMLADWDEYGPSAGMIRNRNMALRADYLVAFWDGKSRGTSNMIDTMKKINKHGEVFLYK